MSGKQSAAVERAIKSWKPGGRVYKHAARYEISVTTLYRALKRAGIPVKANGEVKP